MASSKVTKFTVTFIFAIVLLFRFQHVLATRPLHDENRVSSSFNKNLIVQVLQKGPVPPSAGNPCTNIPGRSHGRCTLMTEMNEVGGGNDGVAYHAPPPPPLSLS
ncbi:hypothetical protein REPUB_Repub16aG0112600 [Reevesia pubescens]